MINVLLTGAGFTANFGAPLAADIYNILFNKEDIQNNPKMRELFINAENIKKSNYEGIYEQVIENDIDGMNDILWEVFSEKIDFYSYNPQWKQINGTRSQDKMLHQLLVKLCYSQDKSIFFTLNQDLFIERQLFKVFHEYSKTNVHIASELHNLNILSPPEKAFKRLFNGTPDMILNMQNKNIKDEEILKRQVDESMKSSAEKLYGEWVDGQSNNTFYVKLHGSLDFFKDGKPLMITGEKKVTRLNVPLIDYYHEIFRDLLNKNDCRLILIGYGFNDNHINSRINEFLGRPNGELFIVTKQTLHAFLEDLDKNHKDILRDELLNKIKGFYPAGLDTPTIDALIKAIP